VHFFHSALGKKSAGKSGASLDIEAADPPLKKIVSQRGEVVVAVVIETAGVLADRKASGDISFSHHDGERLVLKKLTVRGSRGERRVVSQQGS
jgi:hypothetical protein